MPAASDDKNQGLSSLTTEGHNRDSANIDELSPLEIVHLMAREDARVPAAVAEQAGPIARAIEVIVDRLRRGGRLIYVGAGTSGRLGVLDASECPPTFRSPPEQVVGIIAGGAAALTRSIEGAEDLPQEGRRDLQQLPATSLDVVTGVATSGRTPYVLGAIEHARDLGAATIGLCCNAATPLHTLCEITIAPIVGPEIISGSTRLKAGTATKLVLNMLTTASMVLLGKTYGNLMVDLTAVNEKLVQRAQGIVSQTTGLSLAESDRLLRRCQGEVKTALACHLLGVEPEQARARLAQAQGRLREALTLR